MKTLEITPALFNNIKDIILSVGKSGKTELCALEEIKRYADYLCNTLTPLKVRTELNKAFEYSRQNLRVNVEFYYNGVNKHFSTK